MNEAESKTERLFFGVPIDPTIGEALVEQISEMRDNVRRASWEIVDRFHVTLRYLGDTTPALRDEAIRRAEAAFQGQAGFDLTVEGLGRFPDKGPCRVVWASIQQGAAELQSLAMIADRVAAVAGFPPDSQPFEAHVTLGRVKDRRGQGWVKRFVEAQAEEPKTYGIGRADRVVLYQSRLTHIGVEYARVQEFELA